MHLQFGKADKTRIVTVLHSFLNEEKQFMRYLFGVSMETIGYYTQTTAYILLAYSLTKSSALLAFVLIFEAFPPIFFSYISGVIVDKFARSKVLVISQIILAFATFSLFLLIVLNMVAYWQIIIITVITGIVYTISEPARIALVMEIVKRENLPHAVAVESIAFNIAKIIGPAIAGLLIAIWGFGGCYFLALLCFVPSTYFYIKIMKQLKVTEICREKCSILSEAIHGIKYIARNEDILLNFQVVIIMSLFAHCYTVLLPSISADFDSLSGFSYGAMMSVMGIGSLCGGIAMLLFNNFSAKKMAKVVMLILVSSIYILLSYFNKCPLVLFILLGLLGLIITVLTISLDTFVQSRTRREFLGRVLGLNALATSALPSLGNLLAGLVADRLGVDLGFFTCGVVMLLLCIMNARFKTIRR